MGAIEYQQAEEICDAFACHSVRYQSLVKLGAILPAKSILCLLAFGFLLASGFLRALAQNPAPTADHPQRFSVPDGFRIECVADHELTESLWAMTFDPQGRIVVSRQEGTIVTLIDQDNDGRCDLAKEFDERLTHSEGLTFVDGSLYTVGQGPDWVGLYRLTDEDDDDHADRIETVGAFGSKGMGEHAPHGVIYGPDGCLYVVIGNHTRLPEGAESDSPLSWSYEGHLLSRYPDANGHAAGILAPGGTVARIDLENNHWTRIAGGFRNAYDIAFNTAGELFTYDSDMEWDERMPWYRPTRVNHVIPAGDYGWRHGSGKWPPYYPDSLPTTVDLGRGSPCGIVFYQHQHFPKKYHGALFLCDWSRGRIVVVFMQPDGATYSCHAETFVTGRPLNVNDIEVGPDGALYFSIGGRGTEGGVYRIVHQGSRLTAPAQIIATVEAALDQPQPDSAWARARCRKIKQQLGKRWQTDLLNIINNTERNPHERIRALTLLQLFGPPPDESTLTLLAQDTCPSVRAAAVYLLGTQSGNAVGSALIARLQDSNALVRRRTCEALVRAEILPPVGQILSRLADNDRWVRYAARALLHRYDGSQFGKSVLQIDNPRIAVEGMLVLVAGHPSQAQLGEYIKRQISILQAAPADELLLDTLRLVQLTLIQGAKTQSLAPQHPIFLQALEHKDWRIQREAARILAFLDCPQAISKMLDSMEADIPWDQQIHYAYCLRTMKSGWTTEAHRRLIAWFGRTRQWTGGASFSGYLDMLWNDALQLLPPESRDDVLAKLEDSARNNARVPIAPTKRYNHQPADIENFLLHDPASRRGDAEQGHKSFVKAGCVVCHKMGTQLPGRGIGPDLTTVIARFQRHEILDSILYPSRVISDQYKAIHVLTDEGRIVTGIPIGDDEKQLSLKRTNGTKLTLMRENIIRTSKAMSMMPEGALQVLSLEEIAHLFAYLESGLDEQP
jgi:putative membrane-bound dehydrogenase-like protein